MQEKNAEYAIGSPTIELFSNSYRDTHPDQYIECEAKQIHMVNN